jgi:hypothetical protein
MFEWTWAVLHKQLLCRAIPLTLQHPLEKAHAVASSSVTFTTNIQDRGPFKHKNSRIVSIALIAGLRDQIVKKHWKTPIGLRGCPKNNCAI